MTDQIWLSSNFLVDIKREDGKYLSVACLYRGDIYFQEIVDEIHKIQMKFDDSFVNWIQIILKRQKYMLFRKEQK